MKEVNLEAIKAHVSTQYGDMTGVIQMDGHDGPSAIYTLCEDYKFKTDGIFIVGFGLSESTIDGIGRNGKVHCSILFVNKDDFGNSFDEITTALKCIDTLKVFKKSLYINYSDLWKYIKRFDFLVASPMTSLVEEIEIEDIED